MPVDGTYEVQVATPLGEQSMRLALKTEGGVLSGSVESPLGSREFGGGSVSGDEISVNMALDSPIGWMELEFRGRVTGDEIAGEVTAGDFGTMPFRGKRI